MFRKILVAFDGSEGAKFALAKAAELVKATRAEFHVLSVGRIPEYAETVSEVEEAREQANRFYSKVAQEALKDLDQKGISTQFHQDYGKPGDVILRFAETLGADLIILGTKPHSALARRVLGATVDKVVDHAHCSVLVVRSS